MRFPALLLLVVAALAAFSPPAAAQVCRTGKPCGNTCIARNRTCRVGAGTARAAPGSTAPLPSVSSGTVTVPAGALFVASSRGQVYYATSCSAWRSLTAANLIWFSTREEAAGAGYRASTSPGCAGTAGGQAGAPGGAPAVAGPTAPVDPEAACTVAAIVDGDTLDCSDGRRIRLLLIDAPETSQGAFGALAKQALEQLAPQGTVLGVQTDIDLQDQYTRLLAYLVLQDGRMVNEELLRMGVAVVSVYPPNVRHVDRFRAVVDQAQRAKVGLWSLNAFECLPADHRAGKCGR